MEKREFLEYLLDNTSYLKDLEKKLLVEFVSRINESFLKDLFSLLLESKSMVNLKNLSQAYEELLNDEALRLARLSKINFKDKDLRYQYDPLELLKSFYYEKLKNNKIKKGKLCKA